MTRTTILLAVIIAAELLLGWFVLASSEPQSILPQPDMSGFPESTRRGVEKALSSTRPHVAAEVDHLADVFFAAGFYSESELCYRHATTLSPEAPQYHYNLGFCLAAIGDIEGSDAEFHLAIKSGHSRADACWYFIGMNALRANKPAEATEAFQKSQTVATSRIELAQLLIADNQLEESKRLLTALLSEFPNSKRCYQLLAEIAKRNGDTAGNQSANAMADVLYKPIQGPWHARAGKMQEIYLGLGISEQISKLKERTKSKKSLEPGRLQVETDNRIFWDPSLEDYLADVAAANQDNKAQIAHLQRIIDLDGLNSYRAARLGFALLEQQKTEEARQLFKQGIHLPVARSDNGVVDMARALAALESDKNQARTYAAFADFQAGLAFMDELNIPAAEQAFQQATKRNTDSARYWFWLGRSSLLLGHTDVAREAFENCLRLNPHHERAIEFQKTLPSDNKLPN